nr:MAG TPA: hypothetical protein [Caudoviricetes sp.]
MFCEPNLASPIILPLYYIFIYITVKYKLISSR